MQKCQRRAALQVNEPMEQIRPVPAFVPSHPKQREVEVQGWQEGPTHCPLLPGPRDGEHRGRGARPVPESLGLCALGQALSLVWRMESLGDTMGLRGVALNAIRGPWGTSRPLSAGREREYTSAARFPRRTGPSAPWADLRPMVAHSRCAITSGCYDLH